MTAGRRRRLNREKSRHERTLAFAASSAEEPGRGRQRAHHLLGGDTPAPGARERGGARPLGEPLAAGREQERHVGERGRAEAEGAVERELPRRRAKADRRRARRAPPPSPRRRPRPRADTRRCRRRGGARSRRRRRLRPPPARAARPTKSMRSPRPSKRMAGARPAAAARAATSAGSAPRQVPG